MLTEDSSSNSIIYSSQSNSEPVYVTQESEQKYVQIMAGIRKSFPEIGSSASNYIYLLCDPELSEEDMNFDEFLDSIFYVGRGIGARFLDHVRAAQIIIEDDFDPEQYPKEARIIETWLEGKNVKVVCINLDNYAEKTDFIEFAINAFLGPQLTNKKIGRRNGNSC